MVTRSRARRRPAPPPELIRPRPTRVSPATAPVPDGVFVSVEDRTQMAVAPGRAIEPVESSRRAQRGEAPDIVGFRPDWAEMQRVPPLKVVTSRDRLEHRVRAKALSPIVVPLADEAMRFTYPWCTIGRVRSGYMPNFDVAIHNGTGVLVGANLMLTASHLAPWAHGPEGWWMEFTPAFNAQHSVPVPFGRSFVDSYR
jgi:hypothetical protein